jgi:murein DD-endopeptidase MepM/ murein hydrolase activator NlpD
MRAPTAIAPILLSLLVPAAAAPDSTGGSADLAVGIDPKPAYIEARDLQSLNFEFHIANRTAGPVTLKRIELSRYDRTGQLISRRDMDGSGASPAIATLAPDRTVEAGKEGVVYNPFAVFPLNADLGDLRYTLTFSRERDLPDVVRTLPLKPVKWRPATSLILPTQKRTWVLHGHDFYAHHRRWNPLHPIAKGFGATAIFARYALDLMIVDKNGRTRRGTSNANGDFFGWDAALRAPGDGVVVAAYDGEPDDDIATGRSSFDPGRLAKEPLHFYGNYLIVDHGNGEFSLLGHLKQKSLKVKAGDRIRQGQPVAAMGCSGSAEFQPHLHYELRTGTTMAAEGLPAYFRNFRLLSGAGSRPVALGPIDSGDFVLPGSWKR